MLPRRRFRAGGALGVLLPAAVTLSGCGGADGSVGSLETGSASASGTASATGTVSAQPTENDPEALERVDAFLAGEPEGFLVSGSNSMAPEQSRLDASETPLAAGDYVVAAYCSGIGAITYTVAAGATSEAGRLECPEDSVAKSEVRIRLLEEAESFSVALTPEDGAFGASGYRLYHSE